MLTGGCYCGEIRYSVTGSTFLETNCHCSICRRTTGAPLVTWFTVRRSEFQMVQGTPSQFASSSKAWRTFCGKCGTQLTFEHVDYIDTIDVTTSSLNDPELVPPKDHIWTASKPSWVTLCDRLPEYAAERPGG
jgi:hypothetical protein